MLSSADTSAKVPKFLQSVYDILHYEDQRIVRWCHDGTYFQVFDIPRLEREVLPKYFKHSKLSSFQRQLNNFGFHKWTKTRANVCTFSHNVLVQCPHPDYLGAMLVAVAYTHGKSMPSTSSKTAAAISVAPMVGLKRQRSDGASTERSTYSSGMRATTAFATATQVAAVEKKIHAKRVCVDMDMDMDMSMLRNASVNFGVFNMNPDCDLHDADIDHVLDNLVAGGSAGSSAPLLLLDAVDVSDLLAFNWSQAAASGAYHQYLDSPRGISDISEHVYECNSRAAAADMDSSDIVNCDDELLQLLPDPFSLNFEYSSNSWATCQDNIDVTVTLAVGLCDSYDEDELLVSLASDVAFMNGHHE